MGKEYLRTSRTSWFWRPTVDRVFQFLSRNMFLCSLGVLTVMSLYTTAWRDFLSVLNIIYWWLNESSAACVTVSSPELYLTDQPSLPGSQAGPRLSRSSCRLPLPLWHRSGWAPPASPPRRCVVLRHHRCRSPRGSSKRLKTQKNKAVGFPNYEI